MMKSKQLGISIVELMIAMVIAMVLLLVVSQVYVGGVTTQRAQTDVMRLNESARFAFDLITRELRLAGYRNTWSPNSASSEFCADAGTKVPAFLALNDPATINPSAADASFGSGSTTIYSPASSRYNDVLRVRYYGEAGATGAPANAAAATSPVLDCQGYAVAADQLVTDTLFIAVDANNNNEPTLYCYTDNPASPRQAVPLVAGIESMQLLFGQDTDGDNLINRYIPWNQRASGTCRSAVINPNIPANPKPWELMVSGATKTCTADDIRSVKVSVIARTPSAISKDAVAQGPMAHFSASYPAAANSDPSAIFPSAGVNVPNDGRARVMSSTEIALRNPNYCN